MADKACVDNKKETDSEEKIEVFCHCMGPPEPDDSHLAIDQPREAAGACFAKKKIWGGEKMLKVFFINGNKLDEWKHGGNPISTADILGWACIWKKTEFPAIPHFTEVTKAEDADVRVKFSGRGGCWSMVGTDAKTIKDKTEPTMVLSLNGYPPDLQRSLVVHEFGHALGLEHEHQRKDFWDALNRVINIDLMKKHPRVGASHTPEASKAAFDKDWFTKNETSSSATYDPESIMHYRFDIKWIEDKTLHSVDKIDGSSLNEEQKIFLKGLLKRDRLGELPKKPSSQDYKMLQEIYNEFDRPSSSEPD